MEIFKLLESTMANVQPGHSMKHLRRDQLLDNYEAAAKTLQTLMKAKESEISHRKDLLKMLQDSRSYHDNRLAQAKQEYQIVKSHIPENMDLKSIHIKSSTLFDTPSSQERSTTPPMPPPASVTNRLPPPLVPLSQQHQTPPLPLAPPATSKQSAFMQTSASSQSSESGDTHDHNRSSLDRRLSEFLKSFPNLTQAGMAPANSSTVGDHQNHTTSTGPKPTPGYYTQQSPLTAPMQMSAAPPSMELLRFPPPNMMPPGALNQPPPPPPPQANHMVSAPFNHHHQSITNHQQENHESADMDLSDHEDSTSSVPPMIAAAMQQGAGGKTSYPSDGHHFNNPPSVQYTPRLNPLPFDPSIMDPGLRESHSPASTSSSRDKHGGDRSSSGRRSGGGGNNHHASSAGKSRYSSSSSTSSQSSSYREKSRR